MPRRRAALRNGLSASTSTRDSLLNACVRARARAFARARPRAHTFSRRRARCRAPLLLTAADRFQRCRWVRGARWQRRQDPRRERSREGGPHTQHHLATSRHTQLLVMAAGPTPESIIGPANTEPETAALTRCHPERCHPFGVHEADTDIAIESLWKGAGHLEAFLVYLCPRFFLSFFYSHTVTTRDHPLRGARAAARFALSAPPHENREGASGSQECD